jgi:hypothetical protein
MVTGVAAFADSHPLRGAPRAALVPGVSVLALVGLPLRPPANAGPRLAAAARPLPGRAEHVGLEPAREAAIQLVLRLPGPAWRDLPPCSGAHEPPRRRGGRLAALHVGWLPIVRHEVELAAPVDEAPLLDNVLPRAGWHDGGRAAPHLRLPAAYSVGKLVGLVRKARTQRTVPEWGAAMAR